MLQCPNCGVGFAANLGVCPSCESYRVPDSQLVDALLQNAIRQIESGTPVEKVKTRLTDAGIGPADVKFAVAQGRRHARRQTRRAGTIRLLIGAVALAAGIGGMLLFFVRLHAGGPFVTLLAVPVMVFGLFSFLSGLWAVITGRESKLRPPYSVRHLLEGEV